MPRLALNSGAYQARSVIASAQRSLNLFAEPLPTGNQYTGSTGLGEPSQFAHYPTPGLRLLGTLPQGGVRALKQASTGGIYAVAGDGVYWVNGNDWSSVLLGTITSGKTTPVSMQDNGLDLVIVDGSSHGWDVTLATDAFAQINDPNGMFAGADRVDYLDTFLIFNKPNTPQFYISGSLAVTFDPLDFANKESFSDLLVTLIVAKREIWLLGERTTEIWYDVGASDTGAGSFQFAQLPSTFVDHGCAAKYSVASYDNAIYWLSYDRSGQGIVIAGAGYQTTRISTYAIEAELPTYSRIDDAIGFTYSIGGHAFYVLTFPTADTTWSCDLNTKQWHEWRWTDDNGLEHRHRANCAYPINGQVVVGDWENGNLYALDPAVMTDNGAPIKRQRCFPHIINDSDRVFHRQFVADLETGTSGTGTVPQTAVLCSFTAPDGTPLESYSNPADSGLPWQRWAGRAVIMGNAMVGQGVDALYRASAVLPSADYTVTWRVTPTASSLVNDTAVRVIGRCGSAAGYQVTIYSDGSQYLVQLAVLGTAHVYPLGLGLLPSGAYVVTLSMTGPTILVIVQRTSDGLFLRSDGVWVPQTNVPAIQTWDDTWQGAGDLVIGGDYPDWGPVPIGLEDGSGAWALQDGTGLWKWADVPMPDILGLSSLSLVTIPTPNLLFLDWSDDRGHTYGNPVSQSFGGVGEYLTSAQWQRCGYCRDRVYRLTWSTPTPTALQGAWIEVDTSAKT